MTSGRNVGDINKKTAVVMTDIQKSFKDKTNFVSGVSRDEFISLVYRIPIKKVLKMQEKSKDAKWHEIVYIKRYLRNTLHFAIEYVNIKKGADLFNEEFGKRTLKQNTNIYYRITRIEDAQMINKRYKTQAISYAKSGENVLISAEEYEKEIPIMEELQIRN